MSGSSNHGNWGGCSSGGAQAPCYKAQIISKCFFELNNELTLLKWSSQSSNLNLVENLRDVVERETHVMDVPPTEL